MLLVSGVFRSDGIDGIVPAKSGYGVEHGSEHNEEYAKCGNEQCIPWGNKLGICNAFFDVLNQEYRLNLCGTLKHSVTLGGDGSGNITRIENELERFQLKLDVAKGKKEEALSQMENAKEEKQGNVGMELVTKLLSSCKDVDEIKNKDEKTVKNYDFARPAKFSKEHSLPKLERHDNTICKLGCSSA